MAGRGPAPKPPEQRRRTNAPTAGEWIDLPASLDRAVLPELEGDEWSDRTRKAWAAWRSDPVTSQYGPADVQSALDLALLYESWVREPKVAAAGEIRQRQDSLGLTPKGRQDRRWRLMPAADVVDLEPRKSAKDRMKELRARAAAAERPAV